MTQQRIREISSEVIDRVNTLIQGFVGMETAPEGSDRVCCTVK